MKKIIAVFLALSLSFVFVGCGKSDEVPTTTTPYVDSGVNNNYNNDYVININPNIGLENQNLLEETKELLKEIKA